MDLMTPESGTIVWTTITFVALVFALYKIAWKPILSMLEEREQKIRESLQAADKARAEAEQSSEERLRIVREAKNEAQKLLAEARRSAEKMSDDMMRKAQGEAELLLARAKSEIEASRDNVLQQMRDLAVELSMAATEKLIRKDLSREEHQRIIQESMEKMEKLY